MKNKPKTEIEYTFTDKNGNQFWHKGEALHRIGGPAIMWQDGSEDYYQDDRLHREDGPAVISIDGIQEWYVRNMHHRTDGPAVIHRNGSMEWWIKDERINCSSQEQFETKYREWKIRAFK